VTGAGHERPAAWWQSAVFYQLYLRSFCDANGDGIGDIPGIIEHLDYLNDGSDGSLGIDAIWLSPVYPSPMLDFGYDVTDHCGVDPRFGTLADLDRLVRECHRRGFRVVLDFVPNHTSDQHHWFAAARRSRDDPKRDWYCWRDPPAGGGAPNNWLSAFGGSAWEWDELTGQYYLHSFLRQQPDLNWRNPSVVTAMHDVMRFWLRRGIDGFRVDALGVLAKDPQYRDNPTNHLYLPAADIPERNAQRFLYNRNRPEVFEIVRGLRRVVDEFPDRMLVGEVFGPPKTLADFCGGPALDGLHLVFDFRLIGGYDEPFTAWDAAVFRRLVDSLQAELPAGARPGYLLGNHDQPRPASRFGGGALGQARCRAATLLLLTLPGAPFIYYGDEIGMENVPVPPERQRDPARFGSYGRDPDRTPLQWTSAAGAGFSSGTPWLPLGDLRRNVEDQSAVPSSLLNLYRRLSRLRHRSPALSCGSYAPLDGAGPGVFAYLREGGGERYLIAVNFLDGPGEVALPEEATRARIVCTTALERESEELTGELQLGANEACVVRLG
jgi:alpha-glucosidase